MNSENKFSRRRPPRFDLIAGSLCLDFINTLDDRFSSQPKELLKDYVDLARFGEDTGILDPIRVDHLFELSQKNPQPARKALESAIQLREAIYGVVWAVVTKKPVPRAALLLVNQYVQDAATHLSLVEAGAQGNGVTLKKNEKARQFAWQYEDASNDFFAPLWPIAHSAGELLASDELQYVRPCAAENCQWLFLDVSKNHKRVWCDMKKCGNRAKAKAFYTRKRKE
jgi:predicted RNA-binding Zn ribbon-like protein